MFMVFAEVWPGAFVGVILGKRTFGWMEHHAELDYVRCSVHVRIGSQGPFSNPMVGTVRIFSYTVHERIGFQSPLSYPGIGADRPFASGRTLNVYG